MATGSSNEKSGYNPPEGIALLPRSQGPNAPYPPPYTESDSTQVHISQPQPGEAPQRGYIPPQASYPHQGSYPPSQGSYPPMQGSYPPTQGSYPPPQQGYAMPHVAYGPPQPSYPSQGVFAPGPTMQGIYAPGGPITTQPTAWMPPPQNIPDCPRGLEYLSTMDQLLVHQEIELLELMTGLETENKYSILNNIGQRVYFASEESDFCSRNCCGASRTFDLKIIDNYGATVINLHRPLACQACCYPCCLQFMEVSAPPGAVVGTIEQQWSLCFPKLLLKNAAGDTVLCIEGPCCTASCCGNDVEFKLMSPDCSKQVGKISKKWSGYVQEAASDADNFGISFPVDLDVKMKAVVLGSCFLIDMMYYESAPKQRRR